VMKNDYAFDLLQLGAFDLRTKHLEASKTKLAKMLKRSADQSSIPL
jgi:ATP-dependent DNA ligase